MKGIIIKTTPAFDRMAKKIMTYDAVEELYDYLEAHPNKGVVIRGLTHPHEYCIKNKWLV